MVVCAFERESRSEVIKETNHLISRLCQQIKKENSIPKEFLKKEHDKLINLSINADESFPEKEEIIEKALQKLKKEGWPLRESLEKYYHELIIERMAKEIVKKVEKGEDKFGLLTKYGKELKKEYLENGKELGEEVEKLLSENKE